MTTLKGRHREARSPRNTHRARRQRPIARVVALTIGCGALLSGVAYANIPAPHARREVGPSDPRRTAAVTTAVPRPLDSSSPPVATTGPGTFRVAAGTTSTAGNSGRHIAYRVEVEDGLPFEVGDFARDVDRTLADDRGWTKHGRFSFHRDGTGPLRIVLATPSTTDRLCAPLRTRGEVSCRNGNVVAINARRWAKGADSYGDDLAGYRIYVINHEVGHSLGFTHAQCPSRGGVAPVMLQQTLGLDGCEANPWP